MKFVRSWFPSSWTKRETKWKSLIFVFQLGDFFSRKLDRGSVISYVEWSSKFYEVGKNKVSSWIVNKVNNLYSDRCSSYLVVFVHLREEAISFFIDIFFISVREEWLFSLTRIQYLGWISHIINIEMFIKTNSLKETKQTKNLFLSLQEVVFHLFLFFSLNSLW